MAACCLSLLRSGAKLMTGGVTDHEGGGDHGIGGVWQLSAFRWGNLWAIDEEDWDYIIDITSIL